MLPLPLLLLLPLPLPLLLPLLLPLPLPLPLLDWYTEPHDMSASVHAAQPVAMHHSMPAHPVPHKQEITCCACCCLLPTLYACSMPSSSQNHRSTRQRTGSTPQKSCEGGKAHGLWQVGWSIRSGVGGRPTA